MGLGVDVSVHLLVMLSCTLTLLDRLISRFFLNLRSIYHHGQPTLGSRSAPSSVSPVGTHPYWKRVIRATTDISEAETDMYGSLSRRSEGNVPEAATVDLELAIVLQTQHGGYEHSMKPTTDLNPLDNKLPRCSGP
jgi:hypothetical protein